MGRATEIWMIARGETRSNAQVWHDRKMIVIEVTHKDFLKIYLISDS